MKTLDMLQSFVRKGISADDLSYLTKWLMVDYQNITLVEYITKINEFLSMDFFDSPKTIKSIVDFYQQSVESELNSIGNPMH